MKIKAAPGIYLIQEIKEESSIVLGKPKDRKILKGIIIDVGENRDHDQGGKMIATFKKGDTIRFLNYVENYDFFEEMDENGKTQRYYCVLFHDARAYYL